MVYSFVPVLQAAKERRQPIIVTHNLNIAVSGNAELIVALKEHDCLPAGRLMSTMLRRWCAKCWKEQKSGEIRPFAKVTGLSFRPLLRPDDKYIRARHTSEPSYSGE